jgi:hypothetical protein
VADQVAQRRADGLTPAIPRSSPAEQGARRRAPAAIGITGC